MLNKKIVFIGGHHNSALVLAQALKAKSFKIYWFGHKHTMRREKSLSLEYLEVKKARVPFYQIQTGKFYRHYYPWQWLKTFYGFFQSLFLNFRDGLIYLTPDHLFLIVTMKLR